jgi:hypothetical protein
MAITLNGTTGITTPGTDSTTLTVNANNISASNSLGFRNRVINGNMVINQRGAASVTLSGSAQFPVDRFQSIKQTSAATVTAQKSTVAPTGFINSLLFTASTGASPASGDINAFWQSIEGLNTADFGWGTATAQAVTVSFWVRSSVTGTYSFALSNSASNRFYVATYTVSAANTWEQKSVTIAGDTSGTWSTDTSTGIQITFDLGCGSSFNGTGGAWGSSTIFRTSGSVQLIATTGATFYITGVQLEAGSVATPFERIDYGRQLIQCQRYYQVVEGVASTSGGTTNTTYPFLTQMRATPSIGTVVQNTGSGISFATVSVGGTSGQKAIFQTGNSTANAYFYVPVSSEL